MLYLSTTRPVKVQELATKAYCRDFTLVTAQLSLRRSFACSSGPGMKLMMHRLQALLIDMRVNLGC
jgi:hypothetical protein